MTAETWAATGSRQPLLHVLILDGITGATIADVDATSTEDAMAYFLTSPHIDRRHERWEAEKINAEGARLAADVRSSWPSPHSEHPTEQFVTVSRNLAGGRDWEYIARVKEETQ